jgi:hypothetical protein
MQPVIIILDAPTAALILAALVALALFIRTRRAPH